MSFESFICIWFLWSNRTILHTLAVEVSDIAEIENGRELMFPGSDFSPFTCIFFCLFYSFLIVGCDGLRFQLGIAFQQSHVFLRLFNACMESVKHDLSQIFANFFSSKHRCPARYIWWFFFTMSFRVGVSLFSNLLSSSEMSLFHSGNEISDVCFLLVSNCHI